VPVLSSTLPSKQRESDELSGSSRAESDAARPDYVSGVAALAHDLRSPLAAVLGFARLAREELDEGDAARAATLLERLERSATTMEAMLCGALGERAPTRVADLRGALEQVRAERKRELEKRSIRLLAPESPPAFAVHYADLYRLVGNLVGNAIDHMGDVRDATIAVSVDWDDEWAVLRVSDNGAGIEPEARERVFEASHSRCPGEGAARHCGLGLTIVRELAASWGGRAWVDVSAGCGATLCVTVPVAR
jgi:signal transduction histidine kinase